MHENNTIATYVEIALTPIKEIFLEPGAGAARLLMSLGLASLPQEAIWVISYDAIKNIRTVAEVARGDYHQVNVNLPALLSPVFLSAADQLYRGAQPSVG